MSPGIKFTEVVSDKPETCWRCSSLGLPADGIAAGEKHILVETDELQTARACLDCFDRLKKEIADDSEEDAWKNA